MCAKNCVPYLDFDSKLHYNKSKYVHERQQNMKITPIKIAVSMVMGVLATIVFGKLVPVALLIAGVIASILCSVIRRRFDISFLVIAITVSVASLSFSYSTSTRNHPTINYIDKYVTLTGELTSPARESAYNENFRYFLRLESVSNRYGEVKTNETVLLTTPVRLNCGSRVSVRGIIDNLPQQMNENGFDTAMHYKSRDIFTRIFTEDISVISTDSPSLYSLGGRISEFIDGIIYKYYSGDGAAVLSAILTGSTHHFSSEYKDVLSETAFMRFFHPAYLHIWLILAIVGITKKFIPRTLRDILIILIFFSYAVLQSGGTGFSRCLVSFGLATLFRLVYGSDYYPDTMATIVSISVLTMPAIIFNAGFVLSVLGGMLVWAFAPYLTEKLVRVPRFLRRALSVILVCMFLYTPFSICYFNGLCIYAFIMPLITAPLIICALITGPLTLLFMELWGFAPVVSGYTDFVVNTFYKLPYFINNLPLSDINIATPSTATVFAYISGVLLLYYIINNRKRQVYFFSAILTGLVLSIVATSVIRIGTAEFTFVNVDQGDGAVIHTPYRETVVIDGGGGNGWSEYNPGETLFVPYLEAKGYNRIDVAIVSHYHQDHIEGIISMINSIKTDVVFAPAIQDYYSESMLQWADKLKTTAKANGTEIYFVSENTRLTFSDGLVIDIYAPNPMLGLIDENDTTMPVKATYGEFSVLYTGDMTNYGEYSFMNTADVSADVLKVGHHGSRDSSTAEFITGVNPTYSVISCGIDNVYGHPHTETLERLKDTQILRTDLTMDIKITARKNGKCHVAE